MEEQNYSRIAEIFADAIERKASERKSYLDRACDRDVALRHEVESLLRNHSSARAAFDGELKAQLEDAAGSLDDYTLDEFGSAVGSAPPLKDGATVEGAPSHGPATASEVDER